MKLFQMASRCSKYALKLVSHSAGGTKAEGIWKQGDEEDIWAQVAEGNKRLHNE
jgi:hypothetical protein